MSVSNPTSFSSSMLGSTSKLIQQNPLNNSLGYQPGEEQSGGTKGKKAKKRSPKKDKKAPSEKKRVKEIDTFKKPQLEKIAKKHDVSLKGRDGKVKTKEQLFKSLKRKNLV
jgi:trimethylamine:corrinoid methyltransferase-like protein